MTSNQKIWELVILKFFWVDHFKFSFLCSHQNQSMGQNFEKPELPWFSVKNQTLVLNRKKSTKEGHFFCLYMILKLVSIGFLLIIMLFKKGPFLEHGIVVFFVCGADSCTDRLRLYKPNRFQLHHDN